MFNKLRVVHIVVNSIEEATKDYSESFGLEVKSTAENPDGGYRAAVMPMGDGAVLEFVEPTDKDAGPLAKFLKDRGEGIYMMGWEVDSVDDAVKGLQEKGTRLINADLAAGSNAFIHPKSAHGVLVELVEKQ
jgi:methylmalonyl-CoA/ethylmalonyl-CoA epimerase